MNSKPSVPRGLSQREGVALAMAGILCGAIETEKCSRIDAGAQNL
jgi:hypothetical protein